MYRNCLQIVPSSGSTRAMDVLSEIFSSLRLQAGLYFSAVLRGGFAVRLPADRRRIRFHLVLEGACVVTIPEFEQVRLGEGDLVLIPDGASQVLSSETSIAGAVDLAELLSHSPPMEGILHVGEAGPVCRLLCGFLRFDEAIDHPLLASLPPMIVLRQTDAPGSSAIAAALALLRAETDDAGAGQAPVLERIVEILLMQVVRSSLSGHAIYSNGFARALADPRLSRALSAIHSRIDADWNLDTLAGCAGMSRSRFAESFTTAVGLTPFAYLTRWRMIRARELLAQPNLDMAEVAERCGYRSVPAFGRRFVAIFGIGPGEWRRQIQPYRQIAGPPQTI